MKKTYIIAEIGINHQGDLNIAKKLIDIAAAAGCDAVKFQKRNPDICIPEEQKAKLRNWQGVDITYLNYKHKIEFGQEEYIEIDRHCKERNIAWSASPWDMNSVIFLEQYNLPWVKLPSAMLTNDDLLVMCVARFPKVILSTGMSTEKEIDHAVGVLRDAKIAFNKTEPIGLLHCNSSYPAPVNELNLSVIKTLTEKYPDFEIGYSGHELLLGTSVAAVYLGASIVERHITLDRNMEGSDHSCSVTPHGIFKLVSGIRELEQAYGNGNIEVTSTEKAVRQRLRG